jgi:uncharacterized surface protein with fasciclin (FAS1) repeats
MHRLLTLLCLLFIAPFSGEAVTTPLFQEPDLKQFADAAKAAELQDLFTGTGPFTLFVPSNSAFEKFGASKLDQLKKPQNHDALVDLLIYHVLPGKYMANTLKTMDVATISGKQLHISVENGEIRVNNAKVIRTDLVGPNGVIHVIDTVLQP